MVPAPPAPRRRPPLWCGRRRTLALALTLAALWFGAARAQCSLEPGQQSLGLEGFGTAYFEDFTSDRAADRAEFFGSVCIAAGGQSWTLLAERVTVDGVFRGELQLTVDDPTLRLPDLRLTASRLTSREGDLALESVTLFGPEVAGTADGVSYDLVTGTLTLRRPELQLPTLRASGREARFREGVLTLLEGVLTTCTCDGPPLYRVGASRARLDLVNGEVRLDDASVQLGALRLPLGPVALQPQDLAELQLPLSLAVAADGDALGHGLTLLLDRLTPTPGVSVELGVADLDRPPLAPVARLSYRGPATTTADPSGEPPAGGPPTAAFAFALPADGLEVSSTLRKPLAPGLDATLTVRNLATEDDDLHEGVLALEATHTRTRPLPGVRSVALAGATFAAASSERQPDGTVTGARLGARGSAALVGDDTPLGTLRLGLRAAAAWYPDHGAQQASLHLTPSWALSRGPWALEALWERRLVAGASPFEVDRLEPLHRLDGRVALHGDLGGGAEGRFGVRLRLRLPPETEPRVDVLRLDARLETPMFGGRLASFAAADLPGALRGDPGLRADLDLGFDFQHPGWELGLLLRYDLHEGGLTRARLGGGVPFQLGEWRLHPFVALDAAGLGRGDGLALSGHGLDLRYRGCCATVEVGYRLLDGVFQSRLTLRLEPRPLPDPLPRSAGAAVGRMEPQAERPPDSPLDFPVDSPADPPPAGP